MLTEEIYHYYQSLNLKPDASLEETKKAYRKIVKLWHPDRFTYDRQLQREANAKLCEVNEAYRNIIFFISQNEQIAKDEIKKSRFNQRQDVKSKSLRSILKSKKIDLVSLLGKSKNSPEIYQYMSFLKEKPYIDPYGCYYQFKNSGIGILFDYEIVKTLSLYGEGYLGYKQYKGFIPGDLSFNDHRKRIKQKISKPSESGSWNDISNKCKGGVWDKWFYLNYSLYVQYYEDGRISMITLYDE
jgi:curved DNA-binding protein CbpA